MANKLTDAEINRPSQDRDRGNPFVSTAFKMWMAMLVFVLILFSIYSALYFPKSEIVSPQIILGMTLALIGYLWTQEARNKYRLQAINDTLNKTQKMLEHAVFFGRE